MLGIFKGKLGYLLEGVLVSVIIALIIPMIFLMRAWVTDIDFKQEHFLVGFVFSFAVSIGIYFFSVRIVQKIHKHEKSFRSHTLRILLEVGLTCTNSALVMTIVFFTFGYISGFEPRDIRSALFDNIVIAITVNLVVLCIMEITFFFAKWKDSLIESEKLRRQNIESQYAALTSQINPHFLFNSLNALSSLIGDDPKKALRFTKEFAKIYRYVLDSRGKLVVRLEEELNFINSFLYLQSIRFDRALVYKSEVDVSCLDYYLPPLSLQLLVENAIKHNVISEENPLHIIITGTHGEISVRNNYQPNNNNAPPGIGLKNLVERYAHFTDIAPVFKVGNDEYIAIIPLIKDE